MKLHRVHAGASPVRGKALLWLLLAAGVALSIVFWPEGREEQQDGSLAPAPPSTTGTGPSGLAVPEADDQPARDDTDADGSPGTRDPQLRFQGRGSLRGRVVVNGGAHLPEEWTLVLAPSRTLAGRQHAVRKEVLFQGTLSFAVADIPLGGYDVSIRAAGLNSRRSPALIEATAKHVTVDVIVYPRGFIDGVVLRADGAIAEDLEVAIENLETAECLTTRTDAGGRYFFDLVADGEYRILFGAEPHYLLEPQELSFRAPSMHFPKRTLPPVGDLRVRSLDVGGNSIPETVVRFRGPTGRVFEESTDAFGFVLVRNLRPGLWELEAVVESGRGGKVSIKVTEGVQTESFVSVNR